MQSRGRHFHGMPKGLWMLGTVLGFSVFLMAFNHHRVMRIAKRGLNRGLGTIHENVMRTSSVVSNSSEGQPLHRKNMQSKIQQRQVQEVYLENQRLRRLLRLASKIEFEFIPARVIGTGTVGLPGTVHLDVGWKNGCKKDMVLMTESGVAGSVISVNKKSSIGLLLSDPNCRVSARVQRSRAVGIVRWLYGNVCQMEGMTLNEDIRVGDRILTSGHSDIYPPGLCIGTVFEIAPDGDGLFLHVKLRTAVDLDRLEEVLLLTTPVIPS